MTLPPLSPTQMNIVRQELGQLMSELFPICRSLTGNGVRQTLEILKSHLKINVLEIPTGTEVFDWTVPDEWNIKDAYVLDPDGKKVVDFKESNLHVLGYSEPVDTQLSLKELKKHIYTLPDLPDAVPYLTSYYKRRWGFCMRHRDFLALKDGEYTVKNDSTLKPGFLTLGEAILPGEEKKEIFISCYICHPSMGNDSLSGVVLATLLGKQLTQEKRRYTYRIVFVPETIGAITYLSLNREHLVANVHAGLILSFLGDSGTFRYKKSRRGETEIDRVSEHIMNYRLKGSRVVNFYPHLGSDERQYCSPGFNLPMGLLTRTPYLEYPEYHTSKDDLSFVSEKYLAQSFNVIWDIFRAIELNRAYKNRVQYGEPFLSKHNLVSTLGSQKFIEEGKKELMWVLNYCDGEHDLLDIARQLFLCILDLERIVRALLDANLIEPIKP